jgi:hypothetical protein
LLACLRDTEVKSGTLDRICDAVKPLYSHYYNNLSDNALVITFHEWISTAVEEPNLLQFSQKKEEEDAHRSEHTTSK